MEGPQAKTTISLPSFSSVLTGASWDRSENGFFPTPTSYGTSRSRVLLRRNVNGLGAHQPQPPKGTHDPSTPQQRHEMPHRYPSPAHSEDCTSSPEAAEMSRNTSWASSATAPAFKLDPATSSQSSEENASQGDTGLMPTIVHYRPEGVLSARSAQRISESQRGKKKGVKGAGELKIKMVKWDRTDKGTAPLNVPVRTVGPRVCTLCYIMKRKCDRTDGAKPSDSRPCAACQKHNFVCQFITPSQLRDGTTQPPTLESLKMHTTQAQRLQTIALEEKIVQLEGQVEMMGMENRVLRGYIDNLRVWEGIVGAYIGRMKGVLLGIEPGSELLKFRIPAMPAKPQGDVEMDGEEDSQVTAADDQGSREGTVESETQDEGPMLLSQIVDGLTLFPTFSENSNACGG